MDLIYAKIGISNAKKVELKPLEITSLVDTGALFTCIPEHVAVQLGLDEPLC
jgi:predicted aspartyl protease